MDDRLSAVLAANRAFYTALSLADFEAMQQVWLASPEAVCLHPGEPPLHGWDTIRASWQSIFAHQGPLHVWATDEQTRLYPLTAEVTCWENVEMGQVQGLGLVRARASNIFRYVGGRWKMLEHHAYPISDTEPRRWERFSSN
jgi:ketosteroid isomerase-like protein